MIRETTREAIEYLRENNLLSPMRMRIYAKLCEYVESEGTFPTGNELALWIGVTHKGAQSNVLTRLGELRDQGMVKELDKRPCNVSDHNAHAWEPLPQDSPLKFEKSHPRKCPTCKGTGVIQDVQALLF